MRLQLVASRVPASNSGGMGGWGVGVGANVKFAPHLEHRVSKVSVGGPVKLARAKKAYEGSRARIGKVSLVSGLGKGMVTITND
jgi:hypothetical protein